MEVDTFRFFELLDDRIILGIWSTPKLVLWFDYHYNWNEVEHRLQLIILCN